MLRAVLAVVLAVALVAAAMPAVEAARERHAADRAESGLTRVVERAAALAATEEATPGGAARRHLSLSVPDGGFATAPVDYLAVGGVPDCGSPRDTDGGDVVAYRLRGARPRVAHLPVDLRVVAAGTLRADDEPLVVRDDARLTLALATVDGRRTVLVGRGPDPFAGTRWGGAGA